MFLEQESAFDGEKLMVTAINLLGSLKEVRVAERQHLHD